MDTSAPLLFKPVNRDQAAPVSTVLGTYGPSGIATTLTVLMPGPAVASHTPAKKEDGK